MNIHHVGIAVVDLDQAVELYESVFGARLLQRTSSEMDGLEAAFLRMGDAELELMAALREDSPVGKFVAKRGPGLHHIAYGVTDIRRSLDEARAAGLELIDAEPRMGMHGAKIAFVHPKSAGGVLTELVET
ncbi:MAG: methylmalonyl-CoA epimerase [Candidatus Dormibacteraceae bacterium]